MPEHTPVRLVIVEDHELLATSLTLALRLCGMDVETCARPSAEAVIETVRRRAPVLVLLDLDLGEPLGSGLDLILPLIAAGGRVVMMTAIDDGARLGACIEVGAAGIVQKKAGFEDLVDAIRRAGEGEELLSDRDRERYLNDLRLQRLALRSEVLSLAERALADISGHSLYNWAT